MKCCAKFWAILCFSMLSGSAALTAAGSEERHALFTGVLAAHVRGGLVDYQNACHDERLPAYVRQLSETDPSILSEEDSKAFWINAYNAFTLRLICSHYPLKSISELHTGGLIFASAIGKTAWDSRFIQINDRTYSLGQIEHKILRPVYKDARIHFAIVCAARSCPPLRPEAYEGFKLDEQLDDQGRIFLAERHDLNFFDSEERTAEISSIFSWFRKDFGGNQRGLLL